MIKQTTTFLASTLLASVLAVVQPAAAQSEPGWGTRTGATTWANCPSFCTGVFVSKEDGGSADTFAIITETTYASARSSASITAGPVQMPELKAFASSGLGRGADASAFGSQLYSYTGSGPRAVELLVNLTGSVLNNATGYTNNTIGANLAIVRGSEMPWFPSFGSLIFELVNPDDVLARSFLSIATPGQPAPNGILSFELAEGDSFFVVAQLVATSRNGSADAGATLKMNFDNPANLVAVTVVPEPAAWLLLAFGLPGLLVLRRRAGR